MKDDKFDTEGFAALTQIFRDYKDNFTDLTFEPEQPGVMALNPRAFSVTQEIVDITQSSSETAAMLSKLFDTSPKANVVRIDISPSFGLDKDFSPKLKGGTITISGSF